MTLISEVKSTQWQLSTAGLGKIAEGLDDINQCITIILTTKKGTVPLRPEFGCGIYNYVDKPLNIVGPIIIKSVADALKLFEPRIKVTSIVPAYIDGILNINISWNYINTVKTNQTNVNYGIAA